MAELNETPRGNRRHIAFFGLRNAGKSTLVNALTGQPVSLVSAVAGTTTDPVSKAMEIAPLGPCLVTDTAGLDDEGELGLQRVARSREVLATSDIAVWVSADPSNPADIAARAAFEAACARRGVALLAYTRGDDVAAFRQRLAATAPLDRERPLLEGLVSAGDRVVCVCPIDAGAPKGRLILPQQQTIRAALEAGATVAVVTPDTLLREVTPRDLVVTDSQAFARVRDALSASSIKPRLTGFSILFARQKGDFEAYRAGLSAIQTLRAGDRVLIAEGCTHHRQCGDIGTVKLPAALRRLAKVDLEFVFASGAAQPDWTGARLLVQCGGCMLTTREVKRRLEAAQSQGLAVVNYGLVLAAAAGMNQVDAQGFVQY